MSNPFYYRKEFISGQKITSQLKWYEGIVYYDFLRCEHIISVIPFNVIMRLTRKLCVNTYYYFKVGSKKDN